MKSLGRLENLTTDIGATFPDAGDGELFTLQGHATLIDGLYLYVNGAWSLIGETAVAEVMTIEDINGQKLTSFKDTTRGNKRLSVDYTKMVYGHSSIKDLTWLGNSVAIGHDAGYAMPLDGTITMVTAQAQDANNANMTFQLYKNGTYIEDLLTFGGTSGQVLNERVTTTDIDFLQGDHIQVRTIANSGKSMSDVYIVLYVKWRKV